MTSSPPLPDPPDGLEEAWPAPEYRHSQRSIYREAATALFGDYDIDTVIIDAPTGLGKSVLNTALCNFSESAFYTTPQTELRRQLEDDAMLNNDYAVLRGRYDYTCDEAYRRTDEEYTCADCPINNTDERYYYNRLADEVIRGVSLEEAMERVGLTSVSCITQEGCTYWKAKERAMDHQTAILTFAYLITDNFLPKETAVLQNDNEIPAEISFGDRELLVVDEAHSLEGQVASMFVGFTVGENVGGDIRDSVENAIPDTVKDAARSKIKQAPLDDHIVTQDVIRGLLKAADRAESRIVEARRGLDEASGRERQQQEQLITDLEEFIQRVDRYLAPGFDEDNPWVVTAKEADDGDFTFKFKPVLVNDYLREMVWDRADKVVLSSATIPAYGGLDRKSSAISWAERIGLDPETTHVISRGSPFPIENRPIHAGSYVGSMSSGEFARRIDEIAEKIRELSNKHAGDQGLVHTASYRQAEKLGARLEGIAIVHSRSGSESESHVDRWENRSEKDVLISPSLKEGIDLADDQCRWQAAVKVPYASLGSARVRYLKNRMGQNDWYMGEAALSLVQAAGRGVRHEEDECAFYVLDSDFESVISYTPNWFQDAIVR